MSFKTNLYAAFAALVLAHPAKADSSIEIHDAYALSSSMAATAGAAFLVVHNHGDEADRLLSVRSDAARLVQFHTHVIDENGIAKMTEVSDGFDIAPDAELVFERGGDHIMFMGLTAPFEDGKMIAVTLVFEKAGEVEVNIPVDLDRIEDGMTMQHSTDLSTQPSN